MSIAVKILSEARIDIVGTVNWYNEQQNGLGSRFRLALTEAIDLICKHPKMFTERYREIRISPLKKFPYLVYYWLDESHS